MERSTIFNGKIHYKLPFSIAMLNYQRVIVMNSCCLWMPPFIWDQKGFHLVILFGSHCCSCWMSEEDSSIVLRFGNNFRFLGLVLQRRRASFFQAKPHRFDTNSGLKENVFPPEDCTCQIKAAALRFYFFYCWFSFGVKQPWVDRTVRNMDKNIRIIFVDLIPSFVGENPISVGSIKSSKKCAWLSNHSRLGLLVI